MPMFQSPELVAALDAAEAAARVIRELYQKNVAVRLKEDKSPVTEADVRAEEAIKAVLQSRFPGHAFYGEETGRSGDAESLWLVDPIDGTKAFVREYPMFSTQIALMREGRLVLGVSSAPLYGELAWAERGTGAFLNGRPLRVSAIDTIEQAALSSGNLKTLALDAGRWSRYGAVVARLNRIRGYGDFLHYHLLAGGKIDAVVESDVNVLDVGALVTIVEEAGGRFTDLEGREIGLETTTVLATNGRLHETLRAALA
jgi:histidinol-phosphatase